MPLEYGFNDRLKMSSGYATNADVRSVLLQQIPGAVGVTQAATVNDKQGVDWWVEMSTARHIAVDAKVRSSDWAAKNPSEDDLALESWSVVEKNVIGWTRDSSKRCDYILWLWQDTGRFCLIPFPMLCKVFDSNWEQWKAQHKTKQQFTPMSGGGYHSECIFVPRRVLWAEMYRQFSGELSSKSQAV
jgi:hypothetical protein